MTIRQIVNPILDDPREPIENPDATQRCGVGPFWERRTSSSNGFTNLIRRCEVDGTQLLAGDRVIDRVRASTSARGTAAVDEVIHLLCHNYSSVPKLKDRARPFSRCRRQKPDPICTCSSRHAHGSPR